MRAADTPFAEVSPAPFSREFGQELERLIRLRRDVRRFRPDPVDEALVAVCLEALALGPSVGLSEPWRVVRVTSAEARAAVTANFEAANAEALAVQAEERAALYARLKLAGLREAPVHLGVFCDGASDKGAGLGQRTMPEMRAYSVVAAVQNLWLVARALGLGVGWVSILDPERLARDLRVPEAWQLIAYLCLGWPETESETPELERAGWERRTPLDVTER
ncbi:MAG: 5,6-dimethylbenzimidazole synthase [Pseudomonadota bacterium]